MRLKALLFLWASMSLNAWALDVRSTLEEKTNWLSIGAESSSFQVGEGAIRGSGVHLDLSHNFGAKYTMEVFLATALSGGSSVSSSFTGYGGNAYYNLFSSCCERRRTVLVDGVPVINEYQEQRYLFQIGGGLNQYLLNGTKGVYSSSGLGVGANLIFRVPSLFKTLQFKASARTAQMVASETKVQAVFLTFGVVFPL